MIKIAHILHSVGGVDVYMRLLLNNINETKFETIIIHGKNDTHNKFSHKSGIPVKEYNIDITREIALLKDLKSIYDCIKIVRKEKPDLLHVHSAKGGVIGRIVGKITNTQVFYTPHAFSYLSQSNPLKRSLYLWIEKLLANGNSKIIATSQSEKSRAIQDVGYKSNHVFVCNNSIDPIKDILPLNITKTWPEEYICTVGRPSYQKNIELMIRVLFEMNKTSKTHLVIMGVGHHADKLDNVKHLIEKLNMSNQVTLLNWTEREDILNIISNSKLYISTSRYEGLPYSVIEALALSIPCVVSDCDGNKDLILDGHNGYVIKNHSTIDFKDKIIHLLNNEVTHNQFSINSRTEFFNKYNIENNIKNLEKIYIAHSKK
jgi:glycosyltransferase involved in cell wall biosynthesis